MGASMTASVFVFQACYGPAMPTTVDLPRSQTELNEASPNDPVVLPGEDAVAEETENVEETLD